MKSFSNPAAWSLFVTLIGLGTLVTVHTQQQRRSVAVCTAVLAYSAVYCARRRAVAEATRLSSFVGAMPSPPEEAPVVDASLHPILEAARHTSLQMVNRLDALGESRQQLEVLLEGMQDAVLSVDSAGRVQWSNAHMQRLMYRDARGASARQGRALVHTFRDPELLAAVQRTLDSAVPSECRSDAVLPGRVFRVNVSPLPGGAVVVLRDTTETEAMERAQRDFVANVSHELRTPLTSMIGYVETVLDHETLSESASEFLSTALKNASRMQRLTEDLLLLSQVEQGENPLFPQPVSLYELLQDAVQTVSGAPYAEGASFQIVSCPDAMVSADQNAIGQVLGNLLENAVKYSRTSDSAKPKVLLSAGASEQKPDLLEVQVQDFGSGIAAEHLSRIFDRFYRVEKARSRAVGGTGLGLSIARKLVEQHGGTMRVESALGRGSTFFFTLRRAD